MAPLKERLEKAREVWLEGLDGRSYRFRVPTQFWMLRQNALHAANNLPSPGPVDYLRVGLVGWKGVKEVDLVPGGEGVDAEFDVDLCLMWLEDHPAEMNALCERCIDAINRRFTALDALAKK